MSSMFKKRGGLAFKPKIPSTRPRTTAPSPATPVQPSKPIETTPEDDPAEKSSPDLPNASEPEPEAGQSNTVDTTTPTPTEDKDGTRTAPSHAETAQAAPIFSLPQAQPAEPQLPATDEQPRPDDALIPSASLQSETPIPGGDSTQQDSLESSTTNVSENTESTAPPTVLDSIASSTSSSTDTLAKKKRTTRSAVPRKPAADETSSTEPAQSKPRKPRAKRSQNNEEDVDNNEESEPKRRRRQTKEGTQSKSRRARSVTPDDAETLIVDHQKLTMADLTRDLHIGKKFSRHDELRERERQARTKAKSEKDGDGDDATESRDSAEAPSSSNAGTRPRTAASTPSEPQQGPGVQLRMVDGQIVLDQSSLVMDRHARAAAAQQDMETIEENDFTRLITSSSFMNSSKLKGPNIWTAEETTLFYRGLEMFGTDFEIIAKMFPGKQRRHVKLKFNREERHNPKLIDDTLIGKKTTKMDMDEYKALTKTEFESVESIEAQQRKRQEDFEADQQRIADEQAEVMRKKREELFADDDGNVETTEGKKKKNGKNKKKHGESLMLGDPEVVEEL